MSGGVDSAVAAYLMTERGYDCIGVTMKLFQSENAGMTDASNTCCSLEDVEDAKSVARALGIPHYVFNFSERFEKEVIERFVRSYENGATPNPCIDCNRHLKFDALYQRARELGCDCVATGHYARIEYDKSSGRYLLKKALDLNKDQSYVLYSLTQEQLEHTVFPLGELTKSEVRSIAQRKGFVNYAKRDSQDICFVNGRDYAAFIEKYTGKSYPEGDFIDRDGKVLGKHKGIIRYTIGQRKGLGLAFGEPMYVCAVDPSGNTVTLGREEELFSKELRASDVNLISLPKITGSLRVQAKTRYSQKQQWAIASQPFEDELHIVFDNPQRAITKGQALVLYDDDTVLGGGKIL